MVDGCNLGSANGFLPIAGQRAENAGRGLCDWQRCFMSKLPVFVNHHKIAPRRIQTFESTSRFRQPRGQRVTIFPILRIFCKNPFETIATLAFHSAYSNLQRFSRSAGKESFVLYSPAGNGSYARLSVVLRWADQADQSLRTPVAYRLRRLSRSICRSSSPNEMLVSTNLPRRSTNTIVGSVAIPNC